MALFKPVLQRLIKGGVSLWAILGGVGVVFAVLAGLTFDSLHRQDRVGLDLLTQKGLAVMRSVEAGTRAGMMVRDWGLQRLQRLMAETAQQPDIDYILIVDLDGKIRLHSDASRVGHSYGADLDLARLASSSNAHSRMVNGADGHSVLEVYKLFTPVVFFRNHPEGHMGLGGPHQQIGPRRREGAERQDQAGRLHLRHMYQRNLPSLFSGTAPQAFIFVGLDMTPFEAARRADIRGAIGMALVMLVVGTAGVLLLFLSQAYRTTRTRLHREKAFSHNMLEHLPVGVVAVGPEGALLSVNPVARRLLGRDQRGADHEVRLPVGVQQVLKLAAEDRRLVAQEVACEIDGQDLTLEVIVAPLGPSVDREEDLGQVVLIRDLTPIKALQRAVARNQRLAAVGRLAGGVAHEIRNPLSSIKGFATYFKERSQPTDEATEMATILIQEVERLDRVVGQLLDFSRPVKPACWPVSVADFLADSLKRIATTSAEKAVSVDFSLGTDVSEAYFDSDLIHQVLLNLYLNALDAMPEGGRLAVAADLSGDKQHLMIKVSDTGRGIPADSVGQIFDPYFTTKATGTGLGLAIVNNLVEAHGGEVRVQSEPGQGTVFCIRLPLGETPEENRDKSS
jgi:two-component system, NtrC family, sensor histidine kinase HydH